MAKPIASLNYLLSSPRLAQDHNGFSHQDPGFIDDVAEQESGDVRVYLPPDATRFSRGGSLPSRSQDYVNVIVAGKQPASNWLFDGRGDYPLHARRGYVGLGEQDDGGAVSGLAAAATFQPWRRWRRRTCCAETSRSPVRVVNVVDLMRLPDGASIRTGCRQGVRRPVHDRPADRLRLPRLPVADSPADLPADEPRQLPRARLQGGGHDHDAVRHGDAERPRPLPPRHGRDRPGAGLGEPSAAGLRQDMADEQARRRAYTREHGEDPPEMNDWTWPG